MFPRYKSLAEPMIERAQRQPDKLAMVFIADDGSEERITAGQLHGRAVVYARSLQEFGIGPEDAVIIALPHSQALIAAFWGCVYLGATPSIFPYLVPRPNSAIYNKHILTIVRNSEARVVVTDSEFDTELVNSLSSLGCRVFNSQKFLIREESEASTLPGKYTTGEQITYLQYSSGTTGLQKGAKLSHRAVLNFIPAFAQALDIGPEDVVVNWLPLYHDYGLFAGLVIPIAVEIPAVLMSPFRWVRNPKFLLWTIHKYGGTLCWMPNSACNHAVHSIRNSDLIGLDLSSLRVLGSGGEPVLYNSQQMFLERFAPYGFQETALITGYGMAENTMTVTVSPLGKRAPVDWIDTKALQERGRAIPGQPHTLGTMSTVSVGLPMQGAEVAIIDDEGQKLPERQVGQIIIRTNTLFTGYQSRPDLTDEAMDNGWFSTGDLGYLADGQLYICGRKKDLIIVAGKNIYPEDLESIANTVPGIYPDRAVAFGVLDERLGSEKIVIVCDLKRSVNETKKLDIERDLRRRVHQELDVTLGDVHLVKKGWVVKTINGKIARTANREKYKAMMDEHYA